MQALSESVVLLEHLNIGKNCDMNGYLVQMQAYTTVSKRKCNNCYVWEVQFTP